MVKSAKSVIYLFIPIFMSACASSVYEGKYSWDDGWRMGRITEIGPYSSTKHHASDTCAKSLRENADDKIAIIEYQAGRYRGWAILKQAEDANSKIGDLVYVNIKACDLPLVARSENK